MSAIPPDLEALLVALVLAPATYSRNRFFDLYKDPAVRRVRRRATFVRSVVRHLAPMGSLEPGSIVHVASMPSGRVELTYVVSSLGLRRTATLEPVEAALVRFAMSRAQGGVADPGPLTADDADRLRIEAALRRLAPLSSLAPQDRAGGGDRQPSAEQDPIA